MGFEQEEEGRLLIDGVPLNGIIISDEDLADPTKRVWTGSEYDDGYSVIGPLWVTFDKQTWLNMWPDYPHKFTPEQLKIIEEEMPYWHNFFQARRDN